MTKGLIKKFQRVKSRAKFPIKLAVPLQISGKYAISK
jgi:hypothetical protein